MPGNAFDWNRQKATWALLKGLRPTDIDLGKVALLREAKIAALRDRAYLASLLVELGLNDESPGELPQELHPYCGRGLRLWQYPIQFSPYLVRLSQLGIRSYLEIGIRHGGSFVITAEYLERFSPLAFAVGVDLIPCPAMDRYCALNPKAEFWCANTRSVTFRDRLDALDPIDLVFIDSHHEEEQCRAEFDLLAERAGVIAFHDISNVGCAGVGRAWRHVQSMSDFTCCEFVEQYPGLGPFMGIGLAIKKNRPCPSQLR